MNDEAPRAPTNPGSIFEKKAPSDVMVRPVLLTDKAAKHAVKLHS